jgi:hypothetical protein
MPVGACVRQTLSEYRAAVYAATLRLFKGTPCGLNCTRFAVHTASESEESAAAIGPILGILNNSLTQQ